MPKSRKQLTDPISREMVTCEMTQCIYLEPVFLHGTGRTVEREFVDNLKCLAREKGEKLLNPWTRQIIPGTYEVDYRTLSYVDQFLKAHPKEIKNQYVNGAGDKFEDSPEEQSPQGVVEVQPLVGNNVHLSDAIVNDHYSCLKNDILNFFKKANRPCVQLYSFFSGRLTNEDEERELIERIHDCCVFDPIRAGQCLTELHDELKNFHLGAYNSRSPEIKLFNAFIDAGADLNQVICVSWKQSITEQIDRSHSKKNVYDYNFRLTPLSIAIYFGYEVSYIEKLIEQGASLNTATTFVPETYNSIRWRDGHSEMEMHLPTRASLCEFPFHWDPLLLASLTPHITNRFDLVGMLSAKVPQNVELTHARLKNLLQLFERMQRPFATLTLDIPFYESGENKLQYAHVREGLRALGNPIVYQQRMQP